MTLPSVRAHVNRKVMSYMMYRETTLGKALTETLNEFVEENLISRSLAAKTLAIFDKNINKALAYKVKNK
ncbi:Transcription initiation factor IIA, gamma subunit, helical domain protein, partial [Teladorsagia circumcincta]